MPERQIPWRKVASRLAGTFHAKTGVLSSRFYLQAVVQGIAIQVVGKSSPYSSAGGQTEICAQTEDSLGVTLYLVRQQGTVPIFRRFFLRDVLIGDPLFDSDWIINAKREAHAQAFLDNAVQQLIQSVPASTTTYQGAISNWYYDYDVHGHKVVAHTNDLEKNPERLIAAITAAVALAQQPSSLLAGWRILARDLDGRLEHGARFRMDGSTCIHVPINGRRVTISPRIVPLSRRRDRLRTLISCESVGQVRRHKFSWSPEQKSSPFGEHASFIQEAAVNADVVRVWGNQQMIHTELDGNVTQEERILTAAHVVALLAGWDEEGVGPYR